MVKRKILLHKIYTYCYKHLLILTVNRKIFKQTRLVKQQASKQNFQK